MQQAIAKARIEMFDERLAPVLQQLHLDERKLDRVTSILRFCSPATTTAKPGAERNCR
jgi:hypothetical protein